MNAHAHFTYKQILNKAADNTIVIKNYVKRKNKQKQNKMQTQKMRNATSLPIPEK